MSGHNHRTWQNFRVGHFLLTVQLDPPADDHNFQHHRELAETTGRLVSLMNAHHLSATWAASDPAYSAATSLILRSPEKHEMAVLGDANWIGPTAGRTRFARELARRVTQARAAGLTVTTLVPRVATVDRHIDLIVKQGISAIVGTEPSHARRQPLVPKALHYGIWQLPVGAHWPMQPRSWFSLPSWRLGRQLRCAVREAAMFHLVVDVPSIAQQGRSAEQTLTNLIRRVAALRDRGLVNTETLHNTAVRLSALPAATPQQSILRRAA